MMYVQHPQHQHLHIQQNQHQSVQLPHPGLSCQHQDPMQDPFASSATNYTNYASHGLNRFQHHRPSAPSAVQQHHQQQQLHGGQYVSAAGYYVSYPQQMTPTTLGAPGDPRDLGDRSAIASSSSSSASASSSPSAVESSPLQWTKAQDYACAPAPTSAGSSLVFYGTGSHVTEWTGEFSCAKDALTSVGATTNACHRQQQQQQLFSSVGAVGEDDDLNVGQRNLPLCLTGTSGGSSFLSHPPDIRVSTRHPLHSIATLQQGYPPSTHHHLQPMGGAASLGQRSPQSQPPQVSGSQVVVSLGQQGLSSDELRMRGTAEGGGGGGGGRTVNQNQAPPFDWMKRQTYPITPSSGKTRTKDKYRIVYSEHQKVELEKEFLYNPYITIQRKAELANIIGLSDRQVKIWFQNRRAKERKQKKKRPQTTAATGAVNTQSALPPTAQPSKTPRHSETTPMLGGAQLYPLPPSAVADRNGYRGCSAGPMKLDAAAAATGARALLPSEGKCGEVKSESMAPV